MRIFFRKQRNGSSSVAVHEWVAQSFVNFGSTFDQGVCFHKRQLISNFPLLKLIVIV